MQYEYCRHWPKHQSSIRGRECVAVWLRSPLFVVVAAFLPTIPTLSPQVDGYPRSHAVLAARPGLTEKMLRGIFLPFLVQLLWNVG